MTTSKRNFSSVTRWFALSFIQILPVQTHFTEHGRSKQTAMPTKKPVPRFNSSIRSLPLSLPPLSSKKTEITSLSPHVQEESKNNRCGASCGNPKRRRRTQRLHPPADSVSHKPMQEGGKSPRGAPLTMTPRLAPHFYLSTRVRPVDLPFYADFCLALPPLNPLAAHVSPALVWTSHGEGEEGICGGLRMFATCRRSVVVR